MTAGNSDRRSANRYGFNSALEFRSASDSGEDTFIGYTINVSESGLCIGLYRPLAEGERISIQKVFLPFLLGNAIVKWVKEVKKGLYVAGLTLA